MSKSPARSSRRTAAAGVTVGALVAGVGLSATPAQAAEPVRYKATTGTAVVQLVLTLPTALPSIPNPAVLTLIGSDAQAFLGAAGQAPVATTHSYLAGGSLIDDSPLSALLAPLSRTLTASLAKPGTQNANVLDVPSNPLGLGATVGGQSVTVNAAKRTTAATGTVASASLGSLRSLGLGALLDPAFTQLNTALATAISSATPLTDALAGIPALPVIMIPNPLSGVVGGPANIPTPALSGSVLATTISELPAQISALEAQLLDGAAVKLTGVDTNNAITPTTTSVLGTGSSKLAKVELFGGLVTVKATEAVATAKAGLTKSDASTAASATLVEVTIADAFGTLLQAIAADKGITAGLLDGSLGQTLDATVKPTVQAVDGALNNLLATLTGLLESLNSGAKLIQQGTTTKKVSADGHSAEAHATPAEVTLGLPVAPNLVQLSIGKADAVSAVTVAAAPAAVPPATPTPGALPRTGASEGLAAVAALLLMSGLGLAAARRRRTVTL